MFGLGRQGALRTTPALEHTFEVGGAHGQALPLMGLAGAIGASARDADTGVLLVRRGVLGVSVAPPARAPARATLVSRQNVTN